MTATFDPFDVNCFHGKEGSRFVIEWETDEDGEFGPETLRYIETEVNPMYNGGYRFVFEDAVKARFFIFPHEIQSIKVAPK